MELIQWSPKFSVNNALIDSQHKRLVHLINELHTAMKEGRGKATLQKVLDELVLYTKEHFATEEALMIKSKYAGYAAHKKEHDKLTEQATSLQNQHREGKTILTLDVLNFLKDWLVNHIEKEDKKIGAKAA